MITRQSNILPSYCGKLVLLFLILAASAAVKSQTVLEPAKSKNGVYTKTRRGEVTQTISWQTLNTPVYNYDTTALKNADAKIAYYKKYFSTAPIPFRECLYVCPAADPGFLLRENILHHKGWQQPALPSAFLFYADTVKNADPYDPVSAYQMHLLLKKPIEDFYQPYYFKTTEVTNKEYREFVHWVTDSIERTLLTQSGDKRYYLKKTDDALLLNKKEKIHWDDSTVVKTLKPLYLPEEERYYQRNEIDARKILYTYSTANTTIVICVYPDTLAWVHDFPYTYMEPHVNMYFWHPAYDDYPVAGVSRLQAEAFLVWKTRQKQEELDREHSNYTINYELPNELEWEMMETKSKDAFYAQPYIPFADNNFRTDLLIKADTCGSVYTTARSSYSETGTENYHINFPADLKFKPSVYITPIGLVSELCLYKAGLNYKAKKDFISKISDLFEDENHVFFMGGNVSEWMQDNYQGSWVSAYTMHQQLLKKVNTPYAAILLELEKLDNAKNDKNGALVRGANWYDLSLNATAGKNFEGMNKKRFVDPTKQYSTIGFRYVVKIYRKDELERRIKDIPTIPGSIEDYKKENYIH